MKIDQEVKRLNADFLQEEMNWVGNCINLAIEVKFDELLTTLVQAPRQPGAVYYDFIEEHQLSLLERFSLSIALAPYLNPVFLRDLIDSRIEAGGVYDPVRKKYSPTGQTLIYLLGSNDFNTIMDVELLFDAEHFFIRNNILHLENSDMGGVISVSEEFRDKIRFGIYRKPKYSSNFPAHLLETEQTWDQLILPQHTKEHIERILDWVNYGPSIMDNYGLNAVIKKGYRALFYGPPGTGKSMAAALIGKQCGKEVYKVDLSSVISKYVGETEKNLASIFDTAESKDWILFFDEADALFGKRTDQRNAHDRYANQEVSYLLQRIENYDGIIILASNFKDNMDEAFIRRFQCMVWFPMPKPKERKKIWEASFSPKTPLHESVDLDIIAQQYEMSGGSIINVIRDCTVWAVKRGDNIVMPYDVQKAIGYEFSKTGKSI